MVKSHLNYVVADTKKWEQQAAYLHRHHQAVEAFVKNAGLGFAIPYLHNGQMHDYVPDFIVRLEVRRQCDASDSRDEGIRSAGRGEGGGGAAVGAAVNADGRYGDVAVRDGEEDRGRAVSHRSGGKD